MNSSGSNNPSNDKARRLFLNSVYRSSLAIAIARFGLISPMAQVFGDVPRELGSEESIFELQGEVFVDGKKATLTTHIKANSYLETRSNSFIIFRVGKDAHILRENSQMQLEGSNALEAGLHLITGKLLSVFGKRDTGKKHNLRTSTATIGIRGTGVYAESDKEKSYLCTCYGSTKIQSLIEPQQAEIVTTTHHDAPRFILKNPEQGKLIIPAPVFNHTDEELALIEAIVGRESPISAIQGYQRPRRGY
jgi:hypothetical protein